MHGVWLNRYVCLPFAFMLQRAGFKPYLFGYSSVRMGIEGNATRLANFIAQVPENTIHLVGHSLGGVLILYTLEKHQPTRIGRAVFLGSPLLGSQLVRLLLDRWCGKSLVGKSLIDWNPPRLTAWQGNTEIGVIAGVIRFGLASFFSRRLPVPNDGAVAIEETKLPGIKDHLILQVSHTGMLISKAVMRATANFLKTGRFE